MKTFKKNILTFFYGASETNRLQSYMCLLLVDIPPNIHALSTLRWFDLIFIDVAVMSEYPNMDLNKYMNIFGCHII